MRIAIIGATAEDVRKIQIEGESGLLSLYDDIVYLPSKKELRWPNGTIGLIYYGETPARLRGPQHHKAWLDELASYKYPQKTWDMMKMGLRLGDRPQTIVSTTPQPIPIIRRLVERAIEGDAGVRLSTGSTYDNAANLPDDFIAELEETYGGTRLGRQELYAELLTDAAGALWKRDQLESLRVTEDDLPELLRVVVAIDPAVTATEESDETAIIVAGLGSNGHLYVLQEAAGRFSPDAWAKMARFCYRTHQADRIVAEVNNGGDLVEHTLRTVWPASEPFSYKKLHASRGKRARAEPVAALYEQGRVHHVGMLRKLEDEQCTWDATNPNAKSPNCVDALVWAATELALEPRARRRTIANIPYR